MKKIYIVIPVIMAFLNTKAQDFTALATGNYAGVTGVMLQPASIVDSRYKFDINIFSTEINYSNNYFLLDRSVILKFNKSNWNNYQTFKSKYLSESSLAPGEKVFFNISNRTQLPLSFMATMGKKSAIAVNIQSRSIIQGRGISQDFAKIAYNGFYFDPLNNTTIDASGIKLFALNWASVGFTYGRVLLETKNHFLKAAFTAKYLGGVASFDLGSNDFSFGINSDSSINLSSGNFRYNHSKTADFDVAFNKSLKADANSFGFDAGVVYEYRGVRLNNKIIKNDEVAYSADRRDINKYIFRLGVSLVDAGKFTFDNPDNVNSFSGNASNWDVRNGHYNTIKQFDTALAARVSALANSPRSFTAFLPAALSVQFDVRFIKGLFLNFLAYRPVSIGSGIGQRFDNYGYYAITPRFETRHFGIYLPYSLYDKGDFTNYKQNRLGLTLRMGPLFLGSSNLGSMLFNKTLSAADVHVGLKVGFTYGKPDKSSKVLSKLFAKSMPLAYTSVFMKPSVADSAVTPASSQGVNNLIVDYKNGKIYGNPKINAQGNIIIINNNNNYYYGVKPVDSSVQPITTLVLKDYLTIEQKQKDSLANALNDSIKKSLTDTLSKKRATVDSLIKEMQQLRLEMESNEKNDTAAVNIQYNKSLAKEAKDPIATTRDTAAIYFAHNKTKSSKAGFDTVNMDKAILQDSAPLAPTGNFSRNIKSYDTISTTKHYSIKKKRPPVTTVLFSKPCLQILQ